MLLDEVLSPSFQSALPSTWDDFVQCLRFFQKHAVAQHWVIANPENVKEQILCSTTPAIWQYPNQDVAIALEYLETSAAYYVLNTSLQPNLEKVAELNRYRFHLHAVDGKRWKLQCRAFSMYFFSDE